MSTETQRRPAQKIGQRGASQTHVEACARPMTAFVRTRDALEAAAARYPHPSITPVRQYQAD
ncbi:hypothetical protein CIW48_16310 [Methylobacterium sp. P1-11]|nr:hypothetical protein CIW48_16310 [Methylobacterium sp. P1-11]